MTLAEVVRRRGFVAVVAVTAVVTGMAFNLWWAPLVRHHAQWLIPEDMWGTFRAAHYVGWGDIGDLYSSGTNLVTFPAIAVLLAPVAMLSGSLGLSESFPYLLPHPTAWLILGPVEILLGALVLFPLDAVTEHLGMSRGRRAVVAVIGAVAVWPVVVIWGHPEDALAVALALGALLYGWRRQWRPCGWLFGLAVAFQPLVVLMAPVLILGILPSAIERLRACIRSVLPSAALLTIPLVQQWRATTYALVQQPNFPSIDHPTPLLFLSPVLQRSRLAHQGLIPPVVRIHGQFVKTPLPLLHTGDVVAAGPARTVAVVLACVVGVWAWRNHDRLTPVATLWLIGVCLTLRCVFESVMDPYYLWPAVAVTVLVAGRQGWRLAASVTSAAFATWWSYGFHGPWAWWGPIVLALAVALACAWPGWAAFSKRDEVDPDSGTERRRLEHGAPQVARLSADRQPALTPT
jgi:hypothetical protein